MGDRNQMLILGGSSYVGRRLFEKLGPVKAVATYNRTPLESGVHFDSLSMTVSEVVDEPEVFSHAFLLLGDTNPETCVADPDVSHQLNVESIQKVVDELKAWGIKVIFTSSEFVFDGEQGNYVETDPVRPILLYGEQKVAIEHYLQDQGEDACIIRLAKVYGSEWGDGTLFTGWLDAIDNGQTLRCAHDQVFSPIYREDVVDALIRVAEVDCSGIFHLAGPNPYSRLALLQMLLDEIKVYVDVQVEVVSCSILDFDLEEPRPLDVSMNPEKLQRETGFQVRGARVVCAEIVKTAYQSA